MKTPIDQYKSESTKLNPSMSSCIDFLTSFELKFLLNTDKDKDALDQSEVNILILHMGVINLSAH